MLAPSPRLLTLATAALLVAALPLLVHPSLWVAVAAVWGALALASLRDLVALVAVYPAARAALPARVGVGEPVPVRVELAVSLTQPLRAALRLEARAPLAPAEPESTARLLPGRNELAFTLAAPRRGEGHLEALWVRLRGPLGLLDRVDRAALDATTPVAVVPSLARVRRLALRHFGAWNLREGLRLERTRGDGREYDALDAYAPGMDPRAIDWKASARHRALRVRSYRLERNQRVLLCLDTGQLMAVPLADGIERVDHAIHAGLLLAAVALRAGDAVGLHAYGEAPCAWLPPRVGLGQLRRATAACARLRARPAPTNHARGLHDLLARARQRSLVVVFTDFADATALELTTAHLARVAQRHLVVFVALEDELQAQPFAAAPERVEDLARAVVASELAEARRRALARLAHAGVHVVRGPPGEAALRLVARYVEVKRKALLG